MGGSFDNNDLPEESEDSNWDNNIGRDNFDVDAGEGKKDMNGEWGDNVDDVENFENDDAEEWEDASGDEWADSNGDEWENVDKDESTWDNTNTANLGSAEYDQGGENLYNNNLSPGQEGDQVNYNAASSNFDNSGAAAAPSTNNNDFTDVNAGWDTDDDDGFPTSLFLVFLAFFIFFVYRKSTQSNTQQGNHTNTRGERGGYQPVQPGDHNKRW